ncbi:MAG: hypothetical protein ACRDRE_10060 [Pseudonocardiaceae bacterium]
MDCPVRQWLVSRWRCSLRWTVHECSGTIRQYVHAFASVQASVSPLPGESLDLIHTVIKERSP